MADLKSMFSRMQNEDGAGDAESNATHQRSKTESKSKKNTIEKTYQKKSQLEHILLRPDTYIGSVEKAVEQMWIYDSEQEMMIQKQIEYVPGLYKIFDEILVNAADNKQRDAKMDCIKIDIDTENNVISVWNNGQGVPVVMHKDEKMYVPTMIFGHLLTSSNYNDEEDKVTGGRNGYGAKLTNIFSTKFTVETATKQYKAHFKQSWGDNMSKASEPRVSDYRGDDFTKVTFSPDLSKFKMDKLDSDIVGLMSRRAFDVAASSKGVKVFLNGTRVPVKSFKDYIELYIKGKEDESGGNLKITHECANERWEVALTLSDKGFQQVSFVNSIATTKGGRHVDYVTDMIVKQLLEVLKKKNKGGMSIKPFQVKNHMWVFINCLIVNPTFDSQTKENMTLQPKSFGSKCTLSEKFINLVTKSGIVESVLSWAKFKEQNQLAKTSGKKQSKLRGIPKLEDANEAGTKNALKCTLILTEGDSAKTTAVSGLSVIGRDYYGVFPLRGKLLNVREATHKQILENAEINNLIKIIGLQYKKKYNSLDDMKSLRYGKVMIMTDQDQDGSHIKGLLINFIHHNWPELLRLDFLEEFITPIVKAKKKSQVLAFYSLPEFEEWKQATPNHHTFSIKYYKGLGTSSSTEAKEYFSNMDRHRIRFKYEGPQDDDHIVLAFSKKHIEHRKEWLTNFMVESRRRKELNMPEKYLYTKNTKFVTFTDFINLELILFSNADNIRSIPSLVDGLKPGQRKVLFTCLKRNDKKEVKVAQLSGSVGEMSAYHHGEVSLSSTIINLAQNYVGSNNINLLEPRGQFGTRLSGGKDSASPRYIFTKMSPLTRMIFHPHDDPLLKHEYDDNQKIEPVWYIPIIPMVLVNGADGIGTGWMTKIPNYDPREIVKNLRRMMDGKEPVELVPFYKNFKGTIEPYEEGRYVVSGEIAILGNDKVEITELPVGTWTQNYKENTLEPMTQGSEKVKSVLSDYKEYNTDTTVRFVVTLQNGQMREMEREGMHKVFKLQTVLNTSSMCAFDEFGCLKRFDSVMTIFREFYVLRLSMYQKRKEYLQGSLEAEASKLSNQARFISEKCSGVLVVENKKRKTIVDELLQKGYLPDPLKEWKKNLKDEDEEEEEQEQEEEGEDDGEGSSKAKKKPADPEKEFQKLAEVKNFDYLLGMSMWMLTEEKKNELLRQRDNKLSELEILKRKTNADLWREDLDAFAEALEKQEKKEVQEEMKGLKDKVKKTGPAGKKKPSIKNEVLPTADAERIIPMISDDLKKKIQNAVNVKKNRLKKGVKKEGDEDDDGTLKKGVKKEGDEDDDGTSPEKTKKVRKPKEAKESKDGLKQTKLGFNKQNGSPKKKRGKKKSSTSDEDDFTTSESELEINSDSSSDSPAAKKKANNKVLDSDSNDEFDKLISKKSPLFEDKKKTNDKKPAKELKQSKLNFSKATNGSSSGPKKRQKKKVSSDEEDVIISDSDENNSPKKSNDKQESSEDMFDSLVGKKKTTKSNASSESSSKRKKGLDTSDSDDVSSKAKKTKLPAKKPKGGRKKKAGSSSDEDFDLSDKEKLSGEEVPVQRKPVRAGRGTAKKYTFEDDDSDF